MDEEKAGMEELLRRGEEVLLQTADEGQREGLRLRLLRLQAQYTTQRVRENDTVSTLTQQSCNIYILTP